MKAHFPPKDLKQSVYAAAAFCDVFDRPLMRREFSDYLLGVSALQEDIENFLEDDDGLHSRHDYYYMPGREALLTVREARNSVSDLYWKRVWKYVPKLQMVPFIRAVAVCNTLALDNCTFDSDIDLFIITKKNRIFIARVLSTLLFHFLGVRRHGEKISGRFCLSFYVSEDALNLSVMRLEQDPYLYYWMRSLQFVYRYEDTIYGRFYKENDWFSKTVPDGMGNMMKSEQTFFSAFFRKVFEFLLGGFLGDWIEKLLFKKHLQRFAVNKKKLGSRSDVVVNGKMLKFHNIDRRAEYNDRFFERYSSLF